MPAYKGSKVLGSRKNVEDSVSEQIDARDRKDIDKGRRGSHVYRVENYEIPLYPKEFGKLSKYEIDEYKDALKRQNLRGNAYEGFNADTGTGMKKAAGGKMSMENSKKDMAQDKAVVKKAFKMHDAQEHKGEHTNLSKLKKGGMMNMKMKAKKFAAGGITKEMPTSKGMGNMNMAEGGKVKKLAMGGLGTMPMARPGVAPAMAQAPMGMTPMGMTPTYKKGGKIMDKKAYGGKMAAGGKMKPKMASGGSCGKMAAGGKMKPKMYAKGGSVSPDGCATKGKTRAAGYR